jgi:hypothetical protein
MQLKCQQSTKAMEIELLGLANIHHEPKYPAFSMELSEIAVLGALTCQKDRTSEIAAS